VAKWTGQHDVPALADELRGRLAKSLKAAALTERRMFGGVCFLMNGNMLCGAGKNGYMIRTDRAAAVRAEALPGGRPVVMNGRAMAGFYWVDAEACDTKALGRWLALAAEYVAALPPKPAKKGR
jgi:TfoX/Sxy family transcriptional regulator of competence genes